ncbi:MAG: hypothetical protein ACYC3F_01090 [Gemmatimonadaceae bacterium]
MPDHIVTPAGSETRGTGYILLHRRLLEHDELLCEPLRSRTLLEAWIILISLAAYRRHTLIVSHHPVTLLRGEILVSSRGLEKVMGWRSSERVARFLQILVDAGRIIKRRVTPGGTVYLITGYEQYQSPARSLSGAGSVSPSDIGHGSTTGFPADQDTWFRSKNGVDFSHDQDTYQDTWQDGHQDAHRNAEQDNKNAGEGSGNTGNAGNASAALPRAGNRRALPGIPPAEAAKPRRSRKSATTTQAPAPRTARMTPLYAALHARFPGLSRIALDRQTAIAAAHTVELFKGGATAEEVGLQAAEYLKEIETIAHIGWPRFVGGFGAWGEQGGNTGAATKARAAAAVAEYASGDA